MIHENWTSIAKMSWFGWYNDPTLSNSAQFSWTKFQNNLLNLYWRSLKFIPNLPSLWLSTSWTTIKQWQSIFEGANWISNSRRYVLFFKSQRLLFIGWFLEPRRSVVKALLYSSEHTRTYRPLGECRNNMWLETTILVSALTFNDLVLLADANFFEHD